MTDPGLVDGIHANLAAVRARIAQAAARNGRPASDVRLVAISKTFGPDHVRAAHAAGQREFGENRVQEALEKQAALADLDLAWHLVGHLQSNKARKAVGPFTLIHSVDSRDLLRRLDAVAGEEARVVEVLVQVDLAGEATKFGASPDDLGALVETAVGCRWARMAGLMLLPPFFDDPERARPFFQRLRGVRDDLLSRGTPPACLRELSMGMSHDFEVAIEEGATIVRVGTAIFGTRPAPRTA